MRRKPKPNAFGILLILLVTVIAVSAGLAKKNSRGSKEGKKERRVSQRIDRFPLDNETLAGKKRPDSTRDKKLKSRLKATFAAPQEEEGEDPDRPKFLRDKINEGDYIRARNEYVQMKLGMTPGQTYDPMIRARAVDQMKRQEAELRENARKGLIRPEISGTTWTALGPYPIPNGQTQSQTTAVSGRTVAIAVHPTNPDIVFAGAAQGGLYRSLNGGATWTPLFDNAQSLVIGALALSPSNPEILYVGTGEAGQCGSGCYAGIGLYRVDNASTTADLTGPINPQITTGTTTTVTFNAFTGRSISEILIAPTDPSIIFVATASAIVGNPQQTPQGGTVPPLGLRGVFRINNANGPIAGMTIAKLIVTAQPGGFDVPSTGNRSILDLAFDPADNTGNTLVAFVNGAAVAGDGGVYRTTDALTAGTFTQTHIPVTNNIRGEFAVTRVAGVTTMYLAAGETGGTAGCTGAGQGSVRKSTDGGATWSARLAGGSGFCGGQCFYDIAVASSPTDPNLVLLGGNVRGGCSRLNGRSIDGGATFPNADVGLHADAHALTFAPSDPNRVYAGNDGGIFRSDDGGATWTSLNNSTYSATQFQSISMHPSDRWFSIGGTQDNGTNFLQPNADVLPNAGWTRSDFGDGGYARIDKTAADTTNVVMYHTYFNQTNSLIGFSRVSSVACATPGNWAFKGVGAGVFTNACGDVEGANGITASDSVLFYAPLELGPVSGSVGQTVYFGTDRLYRSIDKGDTMTVVSNAGPPAALVTNVPITTIGISPTDDAVRIVGLNNGNVFATTTGGATGAGMTNVTPPGAPARAVGKAVIDPNNHFTALVAYGGQGIPAVNHIWRTTNLDAATPTWTAVGNGIPDVPVNALVYDPANSNSVYAATDIGVFISQDGGLNWAPFGIGLPRIAVFDMALQHANRILRIATHGRGFWEITAVAPTAAPGSISGTITSADGAPLAGVTMRLAGAISATTISDNNGNYHFEDVETDNFYTVTPALANYRFTPTNRSFSLLGNKSDAVFTGEAESVVSANAIDSTEYFVRQQYLDFLGREPDQGGFNYWSDQLNLCGSDTYCIQSRRVGISAAFFIEQEFQQTGSFIFRLYKAALGRHLNYGEFSADRQQVVAGPNLEASRQAFADAFVLRSEFVQKYQAATSADAFVDALLREVAGSGVDLSGERNSLIAEYNIGHTIDESRSLVIRQVADHAALSQAVYNPAFVLMEYFGYLKRDPDQGGFDFWLDVLNTRQQGNYRGMVCAFLTSAEYQRRFGTLVTRSNADCSNVR